MNEEIKNILNNLPNLPGVYQFFDKNNKIIYIGKAKNLKKRVNSYFKKTLHENYKTKMLVKNVFSLKYIVVETESDAFLLENNLIKKYQPKYNIQLKDDKTFPWICIKNEPFPRVFYTRNRINDGSIYFGPYTSVYMVKTLLDLIKQLYQLRTCNYKLLPELINSNKYKVCLEYHIGNCKAPCIGNQSEKDYIQQIDQIKDILKGNLSVVSQYLHKLMNEYSAKFRFEEAQIIKEKIENIKKYTYKSTIVNPSIKNVDVFSICHDEKRAFINYLKVVNGAIIQTHTVELVKKMDETPEELLFFAILDIRNKVTSDSNEIVVPFKLNIELNGIQFHVPKIGDKKKLLELSERNAKYYRLEREKQQDISKKLNRNRDILMQVKKDLRMVNIPQLIECFDNSNLQGTNAVAACVVFKNAQPAKSMYRHYNIKTVIGPNDYASMEEIVFRRYKRLLHEKTDLPQLVIVDGGKGQLSSAYNSLIKLGLENKIAIIGIAKRLEEIFFPNDNIPLYLNKNSETLKLIQRVRDEAHRFGITFHRNKRSKNFLQSELSSINGIGTKTITNLLSKNTSIDRIKKMTKEELQQLIGNSKGTILFNYFNK